MHHWDCWCDESPHAFDDPDNAWRNLWHMLAKELRIPGLVAWLDRQSWVQRIASWRVTAWLGWPAERLFRRRRGRTSR